MKNEEILRKVKQLKKKGRVRAGVTREQGKYIVFIMFGISGGKGLGHIGMKTVMEVIFKKEYSANKLKDMINRLPEHSEIEQT